MSIFWTYLYSIYKLTYILCSYILGISGYHMFWYCDLLRRRTHCQSPKFLKSTVLEHDMAGWCSSWQTDWISRHPRTCDNVFSQRQAKHGWNEWWNLKGEIIGSTRRMTKSQCQKVTEKAKSRDENLNPRPRKRTQVVRLLHVQIWVWAGSGSERFGDYAGSGCIFGVAGVGCRKVKVAGESPAVSLTKPPSYQLNHPIKHNLIAWILSGHGPVQYQRFGGDLSHPLEGAVLRHHYCISLRSILETPRSRDWLKMADSLIPPTSWSDLDSKHLPQWRLSLWECVAAALLVGCDSGAVVNGWVPNPLAKYFNNLRRWMLSTSA